MDTRSRRKTQGSPARPKDEEDKTRMRGGGEEDKRRRRGGQEKDKRTTREGQEEDKGRTIGSQRTTMGQEKDKRRRRGGQEDDKRRTRGPARPGDSSGARPASVASSCFPKTEPKQQTIWRTTPSHVELFLFYSSLIVLQSLKLGRAPKRCKT